MDDSAGSMWSLFAPALGNIISPHSIVAASATVQLVRWEGEMLRRTAIVALGYILLGGLMAWLVFA